MSASSSLVSNPMRSMQSDGTFFEVASNACTRRVEEEKEQGQENYEVVGGGRGRGNYKSCIKVQRIRILKQIRCSTAFPCKVSSNLVLIQSIYIYTLRMHLMTCLSGALWVPLSLLNPGLFLLKTNRWIELILRKGAISP